MRSVTIRDVAREAGFSVATVSNVLRGGQGHVYPEATYAHIRGTAERLGYQANAAARLMRQTNRTLIGMPVQLTEHPYMSRFLLAVHDELLKHDYEPVFLNAGHVFNRGDTAPFPPLQMLAGLVTVGLELQQDWPASYEKLPTGIPMVSLQPVSEAAGKRVDVVQVDFENAYLQVIEHLMGLGHRNIGFLSVFNGPFPSDIAKNAGWFAAMEKFGLRTDFLLDWRRSESSGPYPAGTEKDDYIYKPDGQNVIQDLVARLTAFPEKVTALVCSSDEIAIGVQSFLQAHGWKVPEQISIVGYDGISFGEYIYPSLTTVAPDYSAMSQMAVRYVLERLDPERKGEINVRWTSVKPQLVARASSGLAS